MICLCFDILICCLTHFISHHTVLNIHKFIKVPTQTSITSCQSRLWSYKKKGAVTTFCFNIMFTSRSLRHITHYVLPLCSNVGTLPVSIVPPFTVQCYPTLRYPRSVPRHVGYYVLYHTQKKSLVYYLSLSPYCCLYVSFRSTIISISHSLFILMPTGFSPASVH